MKKLVLILNCVFMSALGISQEYFGTTTFGDGGIEIPYHSAMDSAGNLYASGIYSGTITVGSETITWAGGNADGFLTKFDNDGNPVWVKGFGGGFDDVAVDVAVDANDNIYITGYFQGAGSNAFDADPGPGVFQLMQPSFLLRRDCFIIKLDSNGDFVWAKQVSNPFGAVNEDSKSIEVDSNGNVYIGGSFNFADFDPSPTGTVEIFSTGGGSSPDGFLLKLDTDGNFVWVKTFPSTGIVSIEDIEFDDNEDILIAGRFRNTVDLDPNAGTNNHTSNGGDDIFTAKLDIDGNFIWGNAFGGSGLDIVKSIKNLSSGIYVSGMFSGTVDLDPTAGDNTVVSNGPWDAYLTKLNSDGSYDFSYVLGGETTDFEDFYDVTEGLNGNLFATGSFNGTTDFDAGAGTAETVSNGRADAFLLEITTTGTYMNHWSVGGDHMEIDGQIYFNDNNEVLTLGAFRSSSMDFDPFATEDIQNVVGFYDAYVSRYNIFNVANDGCAGALPLVCGDVVSGETINDSDSGGNAANDEFFSFTGSGMPQLVTVSTCGTADFDTVLRVYDDCSLANELASNDDAAGCAGFTSEVTFLSDGTSTYY
ncbi:hypothetical protein, partial [uncultured Altibacter sp.]|uniref:hypothetical protein n=1 Tax=uncultured Altibacter sp. TaxID=2506933 RepID=UPI0030DDB64B